MLIGKREQSKHSSSNKRRQAEVNCRKKDMVSLLFLLIPFSLYCFLPCAAEATMYRCISRSGSMVYTNVRNSGKCTTLSLRRNSASKRFSLPPIRNSHAYDSLIRTAASRYRVDTTLIKAIIHVESGFNHKAVSSKGAKGLMQLMPQTSRELKVYNPFDPRQNIDGGTRYFRKMMDSFNGDISLSLAAYNAGPALVKRIGRVPAIPETRNYVRKVLKIYRMYKNQ